MKNNITWSEKYVLALKENLTIKEIQLLRDCRAPTATVIRNKAIKYCIENDIEIYTKGIPTAAVLAITKHNLDYYFEKMNQESKRLQLCGA